MRTDHRALLTLFSASGMGRRPLRLHRWSDRLLQYHFDIKYKSGSTNHVAYNISRLQYDINDVNDKVEDDINVFVLAVFGNSMISVVTKHELATCVDSDEKFTC